MSTTGKKITSLGNSLTELLDGIGISQKVKEFEIVNKWSTLVGIKIASASKAVNVKDGVLIVKVKNSAWRNELLYLRKGILEKIADEVGRDVIKEIKLI